jgi:hypothetical protein
LSELLRKEIQRYEKPINVKLKIQLIMMSDSVHDLSSVSRETLRKRYWMNPHNGFRKRNALLGVRGCGE